MFQVVSSFQGLPQDLRRGFGDVLLSYCYGNILVSYLRLSWNQSGPNSFKRERMLSAFGLNKYIGFSDGMFSRLVYWKNHFCRMVICAFALVLEVWCRCWIYLPCRDGHFSFAMLERTCVYFAGKDPHFSGVMTRSNLCYAKFAKDWDYLTGKDPQLSGVMTRSNLCYTSFVEGWIYLRCRKPHRSCATTPRSWIYLPCRDPHVSGVLTRSNLCYAITTRRNRCYATFATDWDYLTGKDLHLSGVRTRSNLCYARLVEDWIYLPCRKPHLSCATTPRFWIYLPCSDPHVSGVMTRSNLCYAIATRSNLWYATFAKDPHLSGGMTRSNLCYASFIADWINLQCRKPHLSCATTQRSWIYLPCSDPHVCGVMTRSNLCYAMFAQDLIYLPCRKSHPSCAMTLRFWIYLSCRDPHLSNVTTRSNLCHATLAKDLDLPTEVILFAGFRGRRIGEASNPGPRLRRRGPRSFEARVAREGRRASTTSAETLLESGDSSLNMLHLNLRGYLSHIAEVTALIRDLPVKPFLVSLNETFLSKAVEQVKLEGYQVLARRDREGR